MAKWYGLQKMIFTKPLKISALSSAIAQLSTVQEKLEEVHYEQATADFYYLSELIKDYIGLVGAVKDVFAVSLNVFWLKEPPALIEYYPLFEFTTLAAEQLS